jgi:CubicO group peptidase (beta-lactamase class C family)
VDTDELLPATKRALLHRIAVAQAEGRAPSMTAGVVRDGRLVWTGARGDVGDGPAADTQYRIGSITKTFVAVLVMRLRDEGVLRLSDRLEQHVPGLSAGGDDRDGQGPTIAELLSHTAGLAAETLAPWWERTSGEVRPELADILSQPPTRHPAGRVFHYSNVGFALLGALVERLRGEGWGDVLRREVLEPLGMTRTSLEPQVPHVSGWAVHPWADVLLPEPSAQTGRMAPAGELWSTVTDLGRWAAFLANGDVRVLSVDSLAEMRTACTGARDGAAYGLGLQLFSTKGHDYVGHGGSMPGFVATLWIDVKEHLGAVVLANTTAGVPIGQITADLLRIVAENEPRLPDAWSPLHVVDPDLLALTGPWYWGPRPFGLRLAADRDLELALLADPAHPVRFRAEADGTWTGLGAYYLGETLRVVRDPAGAVSHLDIGSFVLTREPYPHDGPVPGGVDEGGWRGAEPRDGEDRGAEVRGTDAREA